MLDTELDDEAVARLQDEIDKQPIATVVIEGWPTLGARLMGAMPVEVGS